MEALNRRELHRHGEEQLAMHTPQREDDPRRAALAARHSPQAERGLEVGS